MPRTVRHCVAENDRKKNDRWADVQAVRDQVTAKGREDLRAGGIGRKDGRTGNQLVPEKTTAFKNNNASRHRYRSQRQGADYSH